jgi:hypothetical protein
VAAVGIGSVGTRCVVLLLMSANNDALFLRWEEDRQSVLALDASTESPSPR